MRFARAVPTDPAESMFAEVVDMVASKYDASKIQQGVFGAMMAVELVRTARHTHEHTQTHTNTLMRARASPLTTHIRPTCTPSPLTLACHL